MEDTLYSTFAIHEVVNGLVPFLIRKSIKHLENIMVAYQQEWLKIFVSDLTTIAMVYQDPDLFSIHLH